MTGSEVSSVAETGPEYLELPGLFFHEPSPPAPNTYTKKTLLQSPVIVKIVPQFGICTSKPLTGLASSYTSEERDQTRIPPEQDSFFGDDMSEDDALLDLGNSTTFNASQESLTFETPEKTLEDIEILVKYTSLLVDGVEYPLTAGVTAATVVPRSETDGAPEDSLLIALSSGFQLLIRVWKVPRTFTDASFVHAAAEAPESSTSHVYKPFVVQWWRLSGEDAQGSACSALEAHPSGLAVVSASPESVLRLYTCEKTEMGTQLSPHFNVPINGAILHTCFAHTFDTLGANSQLVLMVLVFTNSQRLEIRLYNWFASEPLEKNLEKTSLPLISTFPFPVMVIPLAGNSSFLFVCPDEFIVVTMNNIWSADYSFQKFAYDGAFPTSFSLGQSSAAGELSESASDEVFLASESGVIYSVIVTDNTQLTCRPVLRTADPISTFALHHSATDSGYILSYASDTAGAKSLYFADLIPEETTRVISKSDKIPYTEATLLKDYKNWTPIVDVSVIDTPASRTCNADSAQELWALTGVGRRTKLSHLRSGYAVKRESQNFEELRKADSLQVLHSSSKQYLLCSMPFGTKLFDYVPEIDEDEMETSEEIAEDPSPLIESSCSAIYTDDFTLCCSFLPDSDVMFQFTRASVTASDMRSNKTSHLTDFVILFAEILGNIAVLAVLKSGCVTLEIVRLSTLVDYEAEGDLLLDKAVFDILHSIPCAEETCMMRCFESQGALLILCGFLGGTLALSRYDTNTGEYSTLSSIDLNRMKKDIKKNSTVIPHDAVFSEKTSKLYVGTKCGIFFEFDLDELLTPSLAQTLTLGTMPLKLVLSEKDPHFLFACMRNVWLFNFYASSTPARVSFEEKTEKIVLHMAELPTSESQNLRFAFLREDGVVIGSVFTHERPILRQLSVGEPAKKLIYLDTSGLFVMLCKSKSQQGRLRFAERKSFKMLPSVEIDPKMGTNRSDWIFAPMEVPTCALVWYINRNERVSKKVIVGTQVNGTRGTLKILDVSKVLVEGSRIPSVKVVELWSITRDSPVTSIQQIGSTIFFSSDCCVYSTSYSLENRRFRPVKNLVTLSSEIINLDVADNDTLLVNSQKDSLYAFRYKEDSESSVPAASSESTSDELSVSFKDPVSRCLANATAVGSKLVAGDMLFSNLRIFEPRTSSPLHGFSFSLSMIPRVYNTSFNAFWRANGEQNQILCMAVNGQAVAVSPVSDQDDEINGLRKLLAEFHKLPMSSSLDMVLDKLDRPFMEKVTGKGFQSVYKPFFDFGENRDKVIDYDVEELSRAQRGNIIL